jgi:hypothetical protein
MTPQALKPYLLPVDVLSSGRRARRLPAMAPQRATVEYVDVGVYAGTVRAYNDSGVCFEMTLHDYE